MSTDPRIGRSYKILLFAVISTALMVVAFSPLISPPATQAENTAASSRDADQDGFRDIRDTMKPPIRLRSDVADRSDPHLRRDRHPTITSASPAGTPGSLWQLLTEFDFDDGLGGPDPQGWVSVDLTAQVDTFFHVDDFNGLSAPYAALKGSQSMWCGARDLPDGECSYSLPGYGSYWSQIFESIPFATSGDVTVSFLVQYDTEANYDYAYVEYLSVSNLWNEVLSFDGVGSGIESALIPADSLDGTAQIRFRFKSDNMGDDQDGIWPTDGAIIIDSLVVSDAGGVVDYQDFEAESVGDLSTMDGHWRATIPPPFGDYAGLFDGTTVLQEDPLLTNTTYMWGFFNGSPDDYGCGGHPEQLVVPFTRNPGSRDEIDYIENAIVSPPIDLSWYTAAPDSFRLEFDVYRDLPENNVVYYDFSWRFLVGGEWTCWRTDFPIYYGDYDSWYHRSYKKEVPPGATHVGVRLEVVDNCWVWCGTTGDGLCHSHAPLFDNVSVFIHRQYDCLVTNTNDSGPGSLRQGILDLNATDGGVIAFDIPGDGPHVIQPLTPLPALTELVTIDGYTQAGSRVNSADPYSPGDAVINVVLDGSLTPPGTSGIVCSAGISTTVTVSGLAIGNFPDAGVRVSGGHAQILGNYIGTDASGTQVRPNGRGVVVETPNTHSLIGWVGGGRNVISGNIGVGVQVDGWCSVECNFIGTDVSGGIALTNGGAAVAVSGGVVANVGAEYGDSYNMIAYDEPGGVVVTGSTTRCKIMNNRIWTDDATSPGIDLGGDGVSANDAGDTDSGPNEMLNFPEIISVIREPSQMHIVGQISGAPAVRTYLIQLFYSPEGSPSQGRQQIGGLPIEITTDATGYASIDFVTNDFHQPSDGWWITATATYDGYTSEFSTPVQIINTSAGTNVGVSVQDPESGAEAYIEFDNVTTGGVTTMATGTSGPPPPSGFAVNDPAMYYEIFTDAIYTDSIRVCFPYDEAALQGDESGVTLLHYDTLLAEPDWVDITSSRHPDMNYVCGRTAHLSPFIMGVSSPSDIGDTPAIPADFALHQNVPNPFNPSTKIAFDVPADAGRVRLAIFDVAGRLVRSLVDGELEPGRRSVEWDGRTQHGRLAASGVYFYRLTGRGFRETKKMVLIK